MDLSSGWNCDTSVDWWNVGKSEDICGKVDKYIQEERVINDFLFSTESPFAFYKNTKIYSVSETEKYRAGYLSDFVYCKRVIQVGLEVLFMEGKNWFIKLGCRVLTKQILTKLGAIKTELA